MKISVMQPYIFPYIGYFKLINSVDKFIFLDDVNFINKGWINRNRLILSNKVCYFTIPLAHASQNKKINTIKIDINDQWKKKIDKSLNQSYSKASNYKSTRELIDPILFKNYDNISEMSKESIKAIANYLEIDVQFIESSASYNNSNLHAQERIIDICKRENGSSYINLPGGVEIYSENKFFEMGIELSFIKPVNITYSHFSENFIPNLSIIDVLMHNEKASIKNAIL